MTNNIEDSYNFLSTLTFEDIQNVLEDIQLIEMGYKIYYIIDTYDIINYSLPFLNINSQNKSRYSQNAIAYNSIFENNSENNLILLDEYRIELLSIKNQLYYKLNNFSSIKNQLRDIISNIDFSDNEDTNRLTDIIKSNFDTIIAYQIFLDLGDNIYDRFLHLFDENLQIFEFKCEDSELLNILNKVFEEVKPGKITDEVFDHFVDEIKYKLLSFNSDTERYIYIENAYRDISAIDRTVNINNRFNKDYSKFKIKYHYLSTAPVKTGIIFNLLKKVDLDYELNIRRNIFQCYLLENYKTGKNKELFIETLSALVDILRIKDHIDKNPILPEKQKNIYSDVVSDVLTQLLKKSEIDLKNTFIFQSYEKYQQKLNTTLLDLKNNNQINPEFLVFLNRIDEIMLEEPGILQSFKTKSINVDKYKQTLILNNKFNGSKLEYNFNIPFGKDIIRNTFHHLPVLLFIENNAQQYQNSLQKIFTLLLMPLDLDERNKNDVLLKNNAFSSFGANSEINKHDDFNNMIFQIVSALSKSNPKNLKELTLEYLIISFINIITLSNGRIEEFNNLINTERDILDTLLIFKRKLVKSSIRPYFVKDSIEVISIDFAFKKELDYLLLWLLRRNHNCELRDRNSTCSECYLNKVIEFGLESINEYHDDGRFNHGLALAYHAKLYGRLLNQCSDNIEIKQLIQLSKEQLFIALEKYYKLEKTTDNDLVKQLINKNIIALHNTIADGFIRNYRISNNESYHNLEEAEIHILYMDKIFEKIKERSIFYSTVTHTKTELLYCKALFEYKKYNYAKANILLNSTIEYEKIISKDRDVLLKYFEDIKTDIANLRNEIIKQSNI